MLLPNFVDMEMKLSLHINDDLQKTVITGQAEITVHLLKLKILKC